MPCLVVRGCVNGAICKKPKNYVLRLQSHDIVLTPLDSSMRKNFFGKMLCSY